MTDLRKAAALALEALEDLDGLDTETECVTIYVTDEIEALRQALAQPDNTSDSATRSADSAESFCKQELHNLMSVAGRMALELECLLLDTENLSVVSKWWDTGMEALQAYRHYVWSVTHGKDGENFCDTHCVHTDHHPDCELAQPEQTVANKSDCGHKTYKPLCQMCRSTKQPEQEYNQAGEPVKNASYWKREHDKLKAAQFEQEPVAWRNAAIRLGEDLYSVGPNGYYDMTAKQWLDWALSVVNTAPPKREWEDHTPPECKTDGEKLAFAFGWWKALEVNRKEWVGLTDDEINKLMQTIDWRKDWLGSWAYKEFARAIEAKLKEKNT